ncbi:hypothetical protein BYT27DRAFT_7181634 [Phlegmacium glaucopus]|nr:hypothetical protein BYT27DRAFT_7181634 [Phlegmacium glaucopus]
MDDGQMMAPGVITPSVPASTTAPSAQVIRVAGVTTAQDFSVSTSVSALALPITSIITQSSSSARLPMNSNSTICLLFSNAQNTLITGGTLIFVHHVTNKLMPRCFCLIWGFGGIGKTQICLKFIEEMSDK